MSDKKKLEQLLRTAYELDLREADEVEVVTAHHEDGWRLWVNVGGINRLRIYRIKQLALRNE